MCVGLRSCGQCDEAVRKKPMSQKHGLGLAMAKDGIEEAQMWFWNGRASFSLETHGAEPRLVKNTRATTLHFRRAFFAG